MSRFGRASEARVSEAEAQARVLEVIRECPGLGLAQLVVRARVHKLGPEATRLAVAALETSGRVVMDEGFRFWLPAADRSGLHGIEAEFEAWAVEHMGRDNYEAESWSTQALMLAAYKAGRESKG